MKVLLLTQVLPYPPDSGPKIKTFNLLKYLAAGHAVTLVSFVRGDQTTDVAELRRICRAVYTVPLQRGLLADSWAMVRSLLTGQPWMMLRDDRAAMRRLVDEVAARTQFDVVHADQLNMAQYAGRVPGARRVLDEHNALWLLYKRLAETMGPGPKKWLLERDWRLLKRYEGRVCREFHAVLTVSQEDRQALEEAVGGTLPATVLPITVDCDELVPVIPMRPTDHILHIGTMYWPPNVDGVKWFIQNVYPLIRTRRPGVTFDVVGANPPQELVRTAGNGSGITVTGYVADPTPYLETAGVLVVPLRAGGGMRVKILNALAQGLPVVTTTLGCEGIAVEPGRHLLVADTPEAFAEATLKVLADERLADDLRRQGRQLIESVYDYRQALCPLDRLYLNHDTEQNSGVLPDHG